ncbi:hypothetical protein ABZ016_13650 [Streptomyces sp. NPDC006372]|uniref:hypothetical protein n=1 Tax=Streptomyces sp. NPDC006372 TaxID=3155599 RepID=UPI0033B9130E
MVQSIRILRGQPIKISYMPMDKATTGLCFFGDGQDTIVVNEAAEPLHRILIVLHELWHLIEDFVGPSRPARLWRTCIIRPLERCGLRRPDTQKSTFGDHSVFELDNVPELLSALPPELVHAALVERRPVRMRGEHNDNADPAEVFARQMLQMLDLGEDTTGTGSITSSFAHRRTGI